MLEENEASSPIAIEVFRLREDNAGVILRSKASGRVATIDAPDAEAVAARLDKAGLRLTDIFVTHHHGDHVEGIPALKARYGARVIGARADAHRIADLDLLVAEGESFDFGGDAVTVLETPGHTVGHISFHIPSAKAAFVGDTLFEMGCGRLFEGTPAEMWASLGKLRGLPAETRLHVGHDYGMTNVRFALSVTPHDPQLEAILAEKKAAGPGGFFAVTTVEREIAINPFLRAADPAFRAAAGFGADADPVQVFAVLREKRNSFR
ncbi:hydroxyacylglutathione hydrolase [Methyloraptor flagellatus]|uniref:Hydroxyacylglutathione hydrolase n=1 Tax=Methyloraptor flagellatus TaxID=3162530 RepID=A0AAU7X8G5_9HYPH